MPGVVVGETSSCANPLLPFFYQENGFLKDIFALRFEVYAVGSGAKVHDAALSVLPCTEGGSRKALGYYVAPFDPEDLELDPGPYELVWYCKVTSISDEILASYRFEILNPKHFRVSSRFVAYLGSDVEALTEWTLEQRQKAIEQASRTVERLTGRFFFPRYMTIKHSVRPTSTQIWIDEPIIGIGEMSYDTASPFSSTPTTYTLDTSVLRIFNRHLSYLLSPDDRQNPKIALVGGLDDPDLPKFVFPQGAQVMLMTGAFGYTDPDGSPFGEVPKPLQEVVLALAYRQLQDPLGIDPMLQSPGRVKKARTRDQEIQFDTTGSAGSASSTMTGDSRLDAILLDYCRPPHVGVAG